MAKDNREILHGIRVTTRNANQKIAKSLTYKSGMEDELAAQFTQAQLNEMVKRGDLSGTWKSTKKDVK